METGTFLHLRSLVVASNMAIRKEVEFITDINPSVISDGFSIFYCSYCTNRTMRSADARGKVFKVSRNMIKNGKDVVGRDV